MATFNGSEQFGSRLQELLTADDIVPGVQASYQVCKELFLYHPFGQKIVDYPLQMAMYKARSLSVPKAPDDGNMLVEAFQKEWKDLRVDSHILNTGRMARIYGIATSAVVTKGGDTKKALNFKKLADADIALSTFDPLNTAGSLVLNQDPNAIDFQKVKGVSVGGKAYHRSRVCVLMNEAPIYIAYESAGFGFVGRSVYQRGLFPLKSFLQTLATDNMIALKAGVLIAKMKSQSSAIDAPMQFLFGAKRQMLKEARTGNIVSIDASEDVESLDLQNLDGPYALARKNIIENIASACGTPAKLLLQETFAEGFGEGTEDAKNIAQFVDGIRAWLTPLYEFMDEIVMYRAWNPEFYKTVQNKYPDEYGYVSYDVAFNEWRNSFVADWPNLLEEPDSEKLKGEDVILKAVLAAVEILVPLLPPEEKARVIEWMTDVLNEKKLLFSSPLVLDFDAIANYEPAPAVEKEPSEPRPESSADSNAKPKWGREDELLRSDAIKFLRGVQKQTA